MKHICFCMCFSAWLTINDTLRTACKIWVALLDIAISRICDIALCIDLTLIAYWSPAPPAGWFATVTELFLAIFAEEKWFIVCHFLIAQPFRWIIAYFIPILRMLIRWLALLSRWGFICSLRSQLYHYIIFRIALNRVELLLGLLIFNLIFILHPRDV